MQKSNLANSSQTKDAKRHSHKNEVKVLSSAPQMASRGSASDDDSETNFSQKVFVIVRSEPKVMVRVGAYLAATLLWDFDKQESDMEQIFLYLFSMEFLQWYEEQKVTHSIVNEKTERVYSILFEFINGSGEKLSALSREEHIRKSREDPSYSKLTYQAYRKEVVEGRLKSFIFQFILKQRELQGKVRDQGRRKKSSEDASAIGAHKLTPKYGTESSAPTVREVTADELFELVKLKPSDRIASLVGN